MKKNFNNINIFILVILFLLGSSVFYFFYSRQKNLVYIYTSVIVVRPQNIQLSAPYFWLPYWIGDSIKIGESENNLFGQSNLTVVDKETYDSNLYGQYVRLVFKMKVDRDKTGKYLYKNKQVLIGSNMDIKLSYTQVTGSVVEIDTELPKPEIRKVTVTTIVKGIESWLAEAIKVGSLIESNKGEIAKVTEKFSDYAQVKVDNSLGQAMVSSDRLKRDLKLKIDLTVKKINGDYYFMDNHKIKVNELVFFPFKDASLTMFVVEVRELN